jgi:glycosyltransferase involved in cell wall biosynthesis
VGVVVPTKDSARTLKACLTSLRNQTLRCSIVVVDNHSKDATSEIANRFADQFVVAGPERSAQRNRGATILGDVDIIGFVDSDMVLEPTVLTEAAALIGSGADAIVVPEHTTGSGFFATVRAFERAQYVGVSRVEAARFFRADLFRFVGGFDNELTAGEDWDLGLRMAAAGAILRHTTAAIWHDEGAVHYLAHCRKKGSYAIGLRTFLAKHGNLGRAVVLDRPYFKRPWRLLKHPVLAAGLVTLKSGEAVAVGVALTRQRRAGGRCPDRLEAP